MDAVALRHQSRSPANSGGFNAKTCLLLVALLGLGSLSSCVNDPHNARCIRGDLQQCRCLADNTYGYQTCDDAGTFSGPCDCVIGLTPVAARVVGYASGSGSGSARDAGVRD